MPKIYNSYGMKMLYCLMDLESVQQSATNYYANISTILTQTFKQHIEL